MDQVDVEGALSQRLHHERTTRGWTLADLAARSGVSRAMLSKIERREASPTATLLGRLSAAFGLTMSQLFSPMENQPEKQPPMGAIARAQDQPVWRDPETGFVRRSLSPPDFSSPGFTSSGRSPLELVWGELPPGARIAYPAASYAFIADQQLVVVSGELTIAQGGVLHALGAGDCLRFTCADSEFRNPGAARCRYVVALVRAGDRQGQAPA